jgi:hypothetical protein
MTLKFRDIDALHIEARMLLSEEATKLVPRSHGPSPAIVVLMWGIKVGTNQSSASIPLI